MISLDSPGFRHAFFAQRYLFAGVLTYLACWLASFNGKRASQDIKAALTALGCAATLLVIQLASFTVLARTGTAVTYSTEMLTFSAGRFALFSAIACLGGWGVFALRGRTLRIPNS